MAKRKFRVIFFIDQGGNRRQNGNQTVTADSEAGAKKKVQKLNNPSGKENLVIVEVYPLS